MLAHLTTLKPHLIGTVFASLPTSNADNIIVCCAVANNLTVIRMFAFPTVDGFNLETEPGVFNESMFQAFDYVVAKAGQLGLKLLPALANNWEYNSNMTQTKDWYADGAESKDAFWTDADIIQTYKNSVQAILTRKNSITGVVYGQDPTFFAWNLINEGRCETANCTAADIQSWITEVAPFVKSLTKSLVTVGQDGFWQASNCHADNVNPVPNNNDWVLATGQDFLPNHLAEGIDYASIHMWSDNWGRTDVPFADGWLYAHMEDAMTIGKPLVLEEFGKASAPFSTNNVIYGEGETEESQMQYYKLVYAITESSINVNGPIKGIAFWRWDAVSSGTILSPLDTALTLMHAALAPAHVLLACIADSTSDAFSEVVLPFSQRVKDKSLAKNVIQGCTPVTAAAPTATPVVAQAGRRLQVSQLFVALLAHDDVASQMPKHVTLPCTSRLLVRLSPTKQKLVTVAMCKIRGNADRKPCCRGQDVA
ncbi:hypothetical protein MMC29_000502 [Sticta canariensis]|nr:hypothetical protein [Sticta canariensis]